jgi:hypothetical protein
MLKKEMMTQAMAEGATSSDDPWEATGAALGLMLGGAMLDRILENMTPVQCTRGLIDTWWGELDLSEFAP